MNKQEQEHFDKYDALAREIGIPVLLTVLAESPSITSERVSRALATGDEHLNSIPLGVWDRLTGYAGDSWWQSFRSREKCPTCKQSLPSRTSGPWRPPTWMPRGRSWSPANCLCVLKHVARYHVDALPKEQKS